MPYPSKVNVSLISVTGGDEASAVVSDSISWFRHYFQVYISADGAVDIMVSVDGTNYGSPPNIQMTGDGGNYLDESGGFYLEGVWPYIKLTTTGNSAVISVQCIQSDPSGSAMMDAG